jgi:hypothetical protein
VTPEELEILKAISCQDVETFLPGGPSSASPPPGVSWSVATSENIGGRSPGARTMGARCSVSPRLPARSAYLVSLSCRHRLRLREGLTPLT